MTTNENLHPIFLNKELKDCIFISFIAECSEHFIDPNLALENEAIVKALKAENGKEVSRILSEEF